MGGEATIARSRNSRQTPHKEGPRPPHGGEKPTELPHVDDGRRSIDDGRMSSLICETGCTIGENDDGKFMIYNAVRKKWNRTT